jgi:hypothetical protein
MTTEDDRGQRAARETAFAILDVIGTADWSAQLADRLAEALTADEARRADILAWLRRTRQEVFGADPAGRAEIKRRAYDEWTDHVLALLTAELTTEARLEAVRSALENASGGVRGWGRSRGGLPGPQRGGISDDIYPGGPPGSDMGADDHRRYERESPPGSDFGNEDH